MWSGGQRVAAVPSETRDVVRATNPGGWFAEGDSNSPPGDSEALPVGMVSGPEMC